MTGIFCVVSIASTNFNLSITMMESSAFRNWTLVSWQGSKALLDRRSQTFLNQDFRPGYPTITQNILKLSPPKQSTASIKPKPSYPLRCSPSRPLSPCESTQVSIRAQIHHLRPQTKLIIPILQLPISPRRNKHKAIPEQTRLHPHLKIISQQSDLCPIVAVCVGIDRDLVGI